MAEWGHKGLGSVALGLLLNKASPVILARAAGSAQKPGKLNDIIWVPLIDGISTQTLSVQASAEECGQGALLVLGNPLILPFLSTKDPGQQLTLILVSVLTHGIPASLCPKRDSAPQEGHQRQLSSLSHSYSNTAQLGQAQGLGRCLLSPVLPALCCHSDRDCSPSGWGLVGPTTRGSRSGAVIPEGGSWVGILGLTALVLQTNMLTSLVCICYH